MYLPKSTSGQTVMKNIPDAQTKQSGKTGLGETQTFQEGLLEGTANFHILERFGKQTALKPLELCVCVCVCILDEGVCVSFSVEEGKPPGQQ